MSQKELSAEERAHWEAFARDFLRTQKKLLERKRALEQQQAEARLLVAVEPENSPAGRYMRLYQRLLASALENLQRLPLTSTLYEPYSAMHEPDYAARETEQTWLRIQMDAIVYEAVALQLEEALKTQGSGAELSAILRAQLGTCERDSAVLDLWKRFLEAERNLRAALEQPVQEWLSFAVRAPAQDLPHFFSRIQVPVLNGVAYRVRSTLRLLPQGEDTVRELRDNWFAAARARAAEQKASPPISQRIRDAFKPSK